MTLSTSGNPMSSSHLVVLDEPTLEFRYGQGMADPHDGLSIFGPYDADQPSHPENISYGCVGSAQGLEAFAQWSGVFSSPIYPEQGLDERLWPYFPGFETAFACKWPSRASRSVTLEMESLLVSAGHRDGHKRVTEVVEYYLGGIERICRSDDAIDVIVCVVPEIVYINCRSMSRVIDGTGNLLPSRIREERRHGQLDMFDSSDPQTYQFSLDFRRQIKARAMKYGVPIQIVRESTLRLTETTDTKNRRLTPLSDRAWNLGVALYYKAGGKPWRLSSAREGVCYIGIAYRRRETHTNTRSACCAAQMFLDTGDGIVFLGEYGPWYSPADKQFHLSRGAAQRLLEGVLKTYEQLEGKPLRELFIHCRSSIDDNEFTGFSEACPPNVKLIGVRVRRERNEARLYREGTRPVLRGTFWNTNDRSGYLWASGFKPRLATYDGWETPVPLRIDIQHGKGDVESVATDILGLTKLNYNACRLGDSEPVTIGFSDAVGEILVSNPTVTERDPRFKFYI